MGRVSPPFGVNSSPLTFRFAWASMVKSHATTLPTHFCLVMTHTQLKPLSLRLELLKWAGLEYHSKYCSVGIRLLLGCNSALILKVNINPIAAE
ncbi:hypothetical protein Y032_0007g3268 [Ancylostoma ceylanicum]|uniref:Uncharacterized protein n=1 Tax=Ancylostoma ceylanicum TaxID=53326 RepID=A0A016VND9_9BILA|nr:hypothetical protein Y032_0007g3268 [Ancylostoma ceylanicum]